jgi:hypothetical protein
MLLASLMEMEFMHRQEELEHLELERALTLSMAMEEERLRALMAEQALQDIRNSNSSISSSWADTKGQDNDDADRYSDAKVCKHCLTVFVFFQYFYIQLLLTKYTLSLLCLPLLLLLHRLLRTQAATPRP